MVRPRPHSCSRRFPLPSPAAPAHVDNTFNNVRNGGGGSACLEFARTDQRYRAYAQFDSDNRFERMA